MKTKKKILSLLLTVCMVLTLMPTTVLAEETSTADTWDGSIATAFAGGNGTADDPYQIATGAELAYLAKNVNGGVDYEETYFVLTQDIDLNRIPWTPIANSFSAVLFGGSDYYVFAGEFDGNGHTISNLTIGTESAPLEADVFGLFGATDGKISNLNLKNVSINGEAKTVSGYVMGLAGALVGSASGPVENCHVTDLSLNMTTPDSGRAAAYWIGGLVGALDGSQYIRKCSVSGNIGETSGQGSIGGLIGELGEKAKISYSRANVVLNVASNYYGGAVVGGFIGKGNGNSNEETIVQNCYATGNVTGGSYTGGFVGSLWGLNIKNCYATGDVTQAAAAMASFVGSDASAGYAYGSIKNCYTTGSVVGTAPNKYAFAMQDATKRSEITNCYFVDLNADIKNTNETSIAKSLEKMKEKDFAALLNDGDDSNGWFFIEGQMPLCGAEPADYSKVDEAIAKADALNKDEYKDFSAVEAAVKAVDRTKSKAEQAEVDAMAKAIEDAIAALEKKPASSGGSYVPVQKPEVVAGAGGRTSQEDNGGTLVITPDEGMQIEKVLVNGVEVKTSDNKIKGLKSGDKVEITFSKIPPTKAEIDQLIKAKTDSLNLKVRTTKTAKKNIKAVVKQDAAFKSLLQEVKDAGYTVKYKFYRSEAKRSGYAARLTKTTGMYLNTEGKAGTKYYYKAKLQILDQDGKPVAETALKQCRFGVRIWTK